MNYNFSMIIFPLVWKRLWRCSNHIETLAPLSTLPAEGKPKNLKVLWAATEVLWYIAKSRPAESRPAESNHAKNQGDSSMHLQDMPLTRGSLYDANLAGQTCGTDFVWVVFLMSVYLPSFIEFLTEKLKLWQFENFDIGNFLVSRVGRWKNG